MLNKYLLSIYGFRYPVFLTFLHMVSCSTLSALVARLGTVSAARLSSRRQAGKVCLLALLFCLTVVLGNVSLRFIPVSFNQAIGATTPAFTAAIGAAVVGHREPSEVYLTLVPVVVGIVIASGAEPLFDAFGFGAAVCATGARAFKSVLQGVLLDDPAERLDSMSLLAYMSPVAALALVPAVAVFEPGAPAAAIELGARHPGFWAALALNCALSYFVNLTNFLVTRATSALTLQVLGNAKGVVAVVVSVLCFRNPVNVYSVVGYAITVGGVVAYSHAKRKAAARRVLGPSATPAASLGSATVGAGIGAPGAGTAGTGVGFADDAKAKAKGVERIGRSGSVGAHLGSAAELRAVAGAADPDVEKQEVLLTAHSASGTATSRPRGRDQARGAAAKGAAAGGAGAGGLAGTGGGAVELGATKHGLRAWTDLPGGKAL